jgi:hypothetical protein
MLPLPRGKRRRRCECEGAMAGERDGRQMDRCRLKLGEESHQDCGSPRQAAGGRTYSGPCTACMLYLWQCLCFRQ